MKIILSVFHEFMHGFIINTLHIIMYLAIMFNNQTTNGSNKMNRSSFTAVSLQLVQVSITAVCAS